MDDILTLAGVEKRYKSGHVALHGVDLAIRRGEIFALLGPNGAGKTTLINIVCGIVTPSAGSVVADGHDTARDYRRARAKIGLVPQELATDVFEKVWDTVAFSRGLFGCPRDDAHLERVLRDLSLWDKRRSRISELSGGMKRRVLIAKALSHEPSILFLDEPTAGVDVSLRRDMWALVRRLRDKGTTIILTTHYIEEAEEMADRIGIITGGRIQLVEEKAKLMSSLGRTELRLDLKAPLGHLPEGLGADASLSDDGYRLTYVQREGSEPIPAILKRIEAAGIDFAGIETRRASLEDIFVDLIGERPA